MSTTDRPGIVPALLMLLWAGCTQAPPTTTTTAPTTPSEQASAAPGPAVGVGEPPPGPKGRDDNGLTMAFRWCPPGAYDLGAMPPQFAAYSGRPVARVEFPRGFWMGKYEVTQAQWARVTGLTVRQQRVRDGEPIRPLGDGSTRDHVGEGPDHPIYFVSHDDILAFCRAFNEQESRAGRLKDGWEYRLPTEAEWEYAARAGDASRPTGLGPSLTGKIANIDGNSPLPRDAEKGPYLRSTTPVGRYPANPWGLHDMHGNVWEWCLDSIARPARTPNAHGARGGCWHNPAALCLATSRFDAPPDLRGSGLGFRLALCPK